MGVRCVKWCSNGKSHPTVVKLVTVEGQPCVGERRRREA